MFTHGCLKNQFCPITCELCRNIQCKVCCPSTASPFSFLSSAGSEGWWTLFWTGRGCWGLQRRYITFHYSRGQGATRPWPIIQTGHLTPLPSLDYRTPVCNQSSFTERSWRDSGTHLLIFQLLFTIFPSWAQNPTWPHGKPRHCEVPLS